MSVVPGLDEIEPVAFDGLRVGDVVVDFTRGSASTSRWVVERGPAAFVVELGHHARTLRCVAGPTTGERKTVQRPRGTQCWRMVARWQ